MNTLIVSLAFLITFSSFVSTVYSCKGCINLDQWSWEKILPKYKVALVKFDVAFPYGDRHDTFTKLAEEFVTNKDIIVLQVGIKDYGDKENKELGERYGVKSKDDLPNVKLFVQGQSGPIDFPFNKEKEWSVTKLRDFIRDNTDIYIGLPGCLQEFDKIAMKFIGSSGKETLLKEAEKLAEALEEKDKAIAKTYTVFMKKIIDQGVQFVNQESARLGKILKEGKLREQKKEEISHRLNILHSFEVKKDEL